jgi:hypothetical protein
MIAGFYAVANIDSVALQAHNRARAYSSNGSSFAGNIHGFTSSVASGMTLVLTSRGNESMGFPSAWYYYVTPSGPRSLVLTQAGDIYRDGTAMSGVSLVSPGVPIFGAWDSDVGATTPMSFGGLSTGGDGADALLMRKAASGNLVTGRVFNAHVDGAAAIASSKIDFSAVAVIGKTDAVQLYVRANATQTAKLQEWRNSSNQALASVDASGGISANSRAGEVFVGGLVTAPAYGAIYMAIPAASRAFTNFVLSSNGGNALLNAPLPSGEVRVTCGNNAPAIRAAFDGSSPTIGFYNAAPIAKPSVAGGAASAVLDELLTKLASLGIISRSGAVTPG